MLHRLLGLTVLVLVASSTRASAQSATCKPSETQSECHARLKCKADEDLEDCQNRLRSQGGSNNQNTDRDDRDERDDRRNDRSDRRDDRADSRDRRGNDNARSRRRGDGRGGDRGRGRGRSSSRNYQTNRTFGLGFELGEPTGLNGKYFVTDTGALDFGVGYAYEHYYYDDGLHLYLDYLWHPVSLASTPGLELPFYVGVGIRYWDFDYCVGNVCDYEGAAIGVRVPIGLAFELNKAPLDIFLQLVPTFDFIQGDYYDRYRERTHLGVDFSVGLRFWIK